MEQVSNYSWRILLHILQSLMYACFMLAVVLMLVSCSSVPEVRYITTQCERPELPRPHLDIEDLTPANTAAQVHQAFETSLMQCVGHVKQLEELNK